MEIYQDVICNREVTDKGVRECDSRYHNIASKVLDKYTRPFTVLDIGANHGYFGFRIAEDYPNATVIMIEGGKEEVPFLRELCQSNNFDNIILLEKLLTLQDLKDLADCETFDVVLALNVIHHFPDNMQQVFNAMKSLGDNLILEVPVENEQACNQKRINSEMPSFNDANKIFETETHTVSNTLMRPTYMFSNMKRTVHKSFWKRDPFEFESPTINSTFSDKIITFKRKDKVLEFKPGINFATFCALNGSYPDKMQVIRSLDEIEFEDDHGDVRPWNMIITGKHIELIDYKDPFNGRDYYDHDCTNLELVMERYDKDLIIPFITEYPESW